MKIGRFYFPPLSMFPVLENKSVTFSCWHVSSVVALCGRRRAGQSSFPLRWPEGGSILSPLRWPEDLLIFAPRAGQSSSALRWLEAGAGGSLFPSARLNLHPVFGGRRGAAQAKAQANATKYHVWVVWVTLGSICSQSDQTETQCS